MHGDTMWVQVAPAFIVGNRQDFVALTADLPTVGARMLILDFFDTRYLDSSALGALESVRNRLQRAGIQVALQNLNPDLRLLFDLTKLGDRYVFFEDASHTKKCALIVPRFDEINQELVEYFAQHPESLHSQLDWRGFELLIEAIFKNHGFRTELGSGRADGGVDLRLLQSDICGELVTLVQIKKYDPSRPIRLEAVQALCATVDDEKANRGLFVTTSRYLPSARSFAERQGTRITLHDGDDVARWCRWLAERRRR